MITFLRYSRINEKYKLVLLVWRSWDCAGDEELVKIGKYFIGLDW